MIKGILQKNRKVYTIIGIPNEQHTLIYHAAEYLPNNDKYDLGS